ncbi:hypothetical protein LTR35_016071 [Friedmanniomyces endolithicus]|uniref:Uncharacterized protein n=1 Tax=Friedmanniomyces endolithicus TaxID=329885 RepID=A0AAN6J632_9PEZI|nr:hypothetical protein LTR35_016071 [Friedmanniomyces endolithicus]KAK0317523.1 hypothetical protein LTR82_011562 [Friedmanniomyces endolithicus]
MSSTLSSYSHWVQGDLVMEIMLGLHDNQEQPQGQELDLVSTSVPSALSPSRVSDTSDSTSGGMCICPVPCSKICVRKYIFRKHLSKDHGIPEPIAASLLQPQRRPSSVADSLGIHADEFIQWCLAQGQAFIRLLEGDRIRVSLGGHRENVLSALREQLGRFRILVGGGVNGSTHDPEAEYTEYPQDLAQRHEPFYAPAEPYLGEGPTVSGLDTPSVQDECPLGDWHDNITPHGEDTDLSVDATFDSFMESTRHSRDDPVLGDSTDYEGSSSLDSDSRYSAVEATPAVLQRLIETVRRGIVPSHTASTRLRCGIYALVGSLNAALSHLGAPLRVKHVMQAMFLNYDAPDEAPQLTPEYDSFIRHHMLNNLNLTAGDDDFEGIWQALTAFDNFGGDQLAILPRFLHQRGMIEREFHVGILAAENGHRGVLATAHIVGNGGAGVPLIWLYNDNAMRLLGAAYNHWSMFAETTDPLDPWRQFFGLDSREDIVRRTSLDSLLAEHDATPDRFPDVMDDFALSQDYINPSFNDLESIREPGEQSGESVTAYAGHADSAQLSERVLSPLLEGDDIVPVNPVRDELVGLKAVSEPEPSNDTNTVSHIEHPDWQWLEDDFDDTLSSGVFFSDYFASAQTETDTSPPAD